MSITIEQFADRWTAWRYTNFNELWESKQNQILTNQDRRTMAKETTKEAFHDIEWDIVEGENTDFAVQYPRMQWVHGEKKASDFNKTGGLFISAEQYPNFVAEGFKAETFITRKDELPGFGSASALISVIRVKHQWVKDEGRNVPLVHALIVVKGCEDLICLSLRGASKALDFQKAFNQHMAHNIAFANRTRPAGSAALEPFALWFPLKAGDIQVITSKDGKNESSVTLPTLAQPASLDRDYIVSLWVGKDNYTRFASLWKDTDRWQKTPIWEQRDEHTSDTPEYTGGDADPITQEQSDQLLHLGNIKQVNIAEYMLEYTNGGSNDIGNLTRGEAKQFIAELAKR